MNLQLTRRREEKEIVGSSACDENEGMKVRIVSERGKNGCTYLRSLCD